MRHMVSETQYVDWASDAKRFGEKVRASKEANESHQKKKNAAPPFV